MARNTSGKVVVVRRKRDRGGSYHGGSWKVAYADFVTALMAFFLVMWIMGMDQDVRDAVEGYFSDPIGFRKAYASGVNIVATGGSFVEVDLKRAIWIARSHQRHQFEQAKQQIEDHLASSPDLRDLEALVEIVVTDDGLRIELVETGDGETFFASGSARLEPAALRLLGVIARALAPLENDVYLEGHTDAAQYVTPGYSNWELSTDRAHAAWRAMVAAGLDEDRIREVRGHADRQLRVPDNPRDPANRRVTILLPFQDPTLQQLQAIDLLTSPARGAE